MDFPENENLWAFDHRDHEYECKNLFHGDATIIFNDCVFEVNFVFVVINYEDVRYRYEIR